MAEELEDRWRAAFAAAESARVRRVKAEVHGLVEEALELAGLELDGYVSPAEAGLDLPAAAMLSGIVATVTAPDAASSANLYVLPVQTARNERERILLCAVGPCRRCGRVCPLEPAYDHWEGRAEIRHAGVAEPAVLWGHALTGRTPIGSHDCTVATVGPAGADGPSGYL